MRTPLPRAALTTGGSDCREAGHHIPNAHVLMRLMRLQLPKYSPLPSAPHVVSMRTTSFVLFQRFVFAGPCSHYHVLDLWLGVWPGATPGDSPTLEIPEPYTLPEKSGTPWRTP